MGGSPLAGWALCVGGLYTEQGPKCVNAKTRLKVAAYRFGARVLIVCEEPESGVVTLATLEEQAAAERGRGE